MMDPLDTIFTPESYGYNLTRIAREGMFPPFDGYDTVVTRVFDVLLRKERSPLHYNPVVITEDDILKWRVILEVVRRLAAGDAPGSLPSFQVVAPDFATLCGISSIPQPQEVREKASEGEEWWVSLLSWPPEKAWSPSEEILSRFQTFLFTKRQAEEPVLFLFPDISRLLRGEPQSYCIDLAPWLVPELARRKMQLLGTSTRDEYRQYVERFGAIQPRMQPVIL